MFSKIFIIGGQDENGIPIKGIEVFNSRTLTIEKVIDENGNWIEIPDTGFAEAACTCGVALNEENAFVFFGGQTFKPTA